MRLTMLLLAILACCAASAQDATITHTATITSLPGVGKKTGERILLELKDAFKDVFLPAPEEEDSAAPVDLLGDAVEALIALGYSSSEAERMVKQAQQYLPENYDLQELLKAALAQNSQQRGESTWRRKG